ncbi:MAG: class I poly(R)-hydroxyalkanoic acid synthase [Alphaproteobacteria bacterium]|nr:class I poly(R)-hydroxyalkanoic acid synthase [Alphaproteobacteria bacterium]
MSDQQNADNADKQIPSPEDMAASMAQIAERSQALVTSFMSNQSGSMGMADPMNVGQAFIELTQQMMANPAQMMQAQMQLWQDYMGLWQSTTQKMMGVEVDASAAPAADDRRFRDSEWDESIVFDYIKQSYLLSSRWLTNTVQEVDGLDDKTAKKVDFYTRQFVDALAPTNFMMTNPEVIRATVESKGENLVKGLENLLSDMERGDGQLRISQVDESAFTLGENVATTPGKVVYQNDLMQLIQFEPTTEKVDKRPLLIVPPWINKYYILDLQPKNSFNKWCTDQGLTVFVISWVNPDKALAAKSFEDYMLEGPLDALDAIEKATGSKEANLIGYCLGGTLAASTLAYMAEHKDTRFKSVTFFTAMVDFREPGELGVFIDEEQLDSLEDRMNADGYLEGSSMATTFNMLRANDLIWSFVVNNYLLGKDPFPFDLLYWNSDSTRMPAEMHRFYLRNMYQENKLIEPGGIELAGTPIDLTKVDLPTFILSTKEDHIAPWKSTYAATQIYTGDVSFCLAGSGHIAGVVNPPAADKYGYWTNTKNPATADQWFESATQHDGSWWPEWRKWLKKNAGGQVAARTPGDGKLKVIEAAPGSYASLRIGAEVEAD